VDPLVAEIQRLVRGRLRARLLERDGAPEFSDEELLEIVEGILTRAVAARDRHALVIPELLRDEEWRLETRMRLASHRPVIGQIVLFAKRWLILPFVRFLHDFYLENTRRQQHMNELLVASIESLAIELALLRREMESLRQSGPPRLVGVRQSDDSQ
jgi:hypothetical protein